ncbi:MAG: hypothetical protein IJA60_07610 [Clostridia bacterium]|nr:hypothetical protein [Clostridia bacterium]
MKKIIKIVACVLLAVALAFCALCVYAATYSSEDDPLISLSYVNEVLLPQIKDMINDAVSGADIGDVTVTAPPETTEPEPEEEYPEGTVNTGSRYNTVNLKEGETLYASVNSCEVIVRSGSTKVVSPFTVKWEEQGVADTTAGTDIYNDEAVPNNHTIIIPRDDGRGITTLEGGAWVMVRGDYIIKDESGEVINK